jgi:putative copper export protein
MHNALHSIWALKIFLSLHVAFAAMFVGGNVFLDFILTPRLELIPPGQAARLSGKMGNDFALFNWICLIGILVTGMLTMWHKGITGSVFDTTFITTSYGAALLVKEILWTTLIFTGAMMTFYLRPRVIVKLPYDASRESIEADREDTIRYADWMRRLARYNGVAAVIALISGVFMNQGGLW